MAICEVKLRSPSLGDQFDALLGSSQLYSEYQPIMGLQTGDILGWEALIRGPRESYFNTPARIFDHAEGAGRLFELERACRRRALTGLGELAPGQRLFLNVHPHTMADPGFRPGETLKLLQEFGLHPRQVVLEITERHSIQGFELFQRTLEHYRRQGYQAAIDDMGAGYSGLARLAKLQPKFIKVDMSIVRGVDSNPINRAIIEALVTLADKIGIYVIAEGVETDTELSTLASLKVHYGQGFYLGRPRRIKEHPDIPPPIILGGARPLAADRTPWSCSIPIQRLMEKPLIVDPSLPVKEVKSLLDRRPVGGIVVARDQKPLGLVMSYELDRQLSAYFGVSLYYEKPIEHIMNTDPMIVDASTPLEDAAAAAMNRNQLNLYDHIIVVENKRLAGIVSVQKMMDALARVQLELAKGANPLTGLPGRVALDQELERLWARKRLFGLIYVDLDNFKAYNDCYGFELGDRMLRLVGRILSWAGRKYGGEDSFVGHLGGDDFVMLADASRSERVCQAVIACFKRLVRQHYKGEDLQRGYTLCEGRDGKPHKFPLATISLGIVDCQGRCELGVLSQRTAEVKKYAKSLAGDSYVHDRRAPLGSPDPSSGDGPGPRCGRRYRPARGPRAIPGGFAAKFCS